MLAWIKDYYQHLTHYHYPADTTSIHNVQFALRLYRQRGTIKTCDHCLQGLILVERN